jgi:hypothetical protein
MVVSRSALFETFEDRGSNASFNPTLGEVIGVRLSRREVMRGALAASAISAVMSDASVARSAQPAKRFNFRELDVAPDQTHHVAEGYDAEVLVRWGDPLFSNSPAFDPKRATVETQAGQFGYNNDFLGYLPINGRSDHGLLVVNHEYTNEELMFPGLPEQSDKDVFFANTTAEFVGIEMMAHGGSVLEIRKSGGKWTMQTDSKYTRRITAETEMRISGPAAGNNRLKTSADPTGTRVKGMLNNCAGGITPWGTWLTCEENFNFYFWGKDAAKSHSDARAFERYGLPAEKQGWAKFHDRFDMAKEPNEVNRFGWVVEIDPFDPASVPVKRTAMGRFKHEGAGNIINKDGRFVVYQGDDERFDYVYRFVTEAAVDLERPSANKDILDQGTLSVARFNPDGSGEWLPLVHGTSPWLTEQFGFKDQGDVVIHARLAADLLGATKMDRPEDVEVSPSEGRVYVMLTNNSKREESGIKGINAANPRPNNKHGHIIEITPEGGDHAARTFRWDILVKCGDPKVATIGATFNPETSAKGWFGMPDNCAFDAMGRLWIATDGNSVDRTGRQDGLWSIETEGSARGTAKCFFQVPVGAELCGPCFTPDMETLFVAVQHPGEVTEDDVGISRSTFDDPMTRWPDFKPDMPPRPSVVAITRKGGGKIGV